MKAVTIRDLRLHWPATEKSLRLEGELTVTRDGVPVAKLIKFTPPPKRRKRWDPEEHKRWMKRVWGGKSVALVDKYLAKDRADRWSEES